MTLSACDRYNRLYSVPIRYDDRYMNTANTAFSVLFGKRLHPTVARRLLAIRISARGLSRRHGIRPTVRVACVSMAEMVGGV